MKNRIIYSLKAALVVALSMISPSSALADEAAVLQRPGMIDFVNDMMVKYEFERASLNAILSQARIQESIVAAISRPAEGKAWEQYHPLFINPTRINGGVRFWHAHDDALTRARHEYGVPESIIAAIIGVETTYGKNTGTYRVLDALTTLAFSYPPRAEYFRSELEQFLLLARDEALDPLSMKGSYAGAMGIGQFMPGSYRRYAVDFNHDGRRDIVRDMTDAIGSVANYFKMHGWQTGHPVAVRAQVAGEQYQALLKEGIEPRRSLSQFKALGVTSQQEISGDPVAALFKLDTKNGPEYWLGFKNFYVITRYNRSIYYAMSVYQLSSGIEDAHKQ